MLSDVSALIGVFLSTVTKHMLKKRFVVQRSLVVK